MNGQWIQTAVALLIVLIAVAVVASRIRRTIIAARHPKDGAGCGAGCGCGDA